VQFLGIGSPVYTSKNYAALAKEGYERNVTVYRAVSLIAQSCAGIPWKLYQKGSKLREIENHPLLDLLHNPNPRHSQSGFVEEVISFWLLAGNSYVTVVRPSVRAKPSELWALRPDRMRVVPGVTDIAGYQYEANGQLSFFQANDILHLRMFSATDDWYGLSPLLVAGALIDQQNEGADWNTAILQNSGRPSGALIAAGALGNDQYDRLRRVIRERYTGKRNAGTPMLLEGGLDWKPFSMTPLELDWGTSRTLNARDIAIALGVPPELLGDSSNKTYNNYAESRKSFYQETVLPLMDRFRDRLNVWLTDSWSTDLYLDYDKEDIEALQEERDKLSARMIAQWSAGITTMNEARKAVGLEEVTGGDIYQLPIASSIYVPDSSLVELVETKLENLLAPPQPLPGAPAPPAQAPDDDTGPQDTGTQQSAEAGAATSAQSQQKPAPSAPAKKPKLAVVKSTHVSEIKAVNALYKDLEEQAMHDLTIYFAKEQQRVVEAAKGAVVSTTIEARIDHELDKCMPLLEETLLGVYERSSAKSAEVTAQALAPGKAIGIFSNGEHFFKKLAKKIAALIHGTTREEIGHAVAYGAVKGESVQQIANRIGSVYDTEIKTTRAQRIATTEANTAANHGAMQAAKDVSDSSGFSLQKQWVTMGDEHVRKAHSEAEGEIVDLDAPFVVGGEELLYPGDSSLGASASNTVFCRCKLVYLHDGTKTRKLVCNRQKNWNERELGEIAALQEVLSGCTKELVFECSFTGNDIEEALQASCKALLRASLTKIHPSMPFEKIINHTLAPYIAEHVQRVAPATSQIRQSAKSVLSVQTQDIAPWLYQFAQEANEARAHDDGGSKVVEGKRLEKPSSGGSGGGGAGGGAKPLDKSGFPTSEALANAELVPFGDHGSNAAYTTTIAGEKFFVKSADASGVDDLGMNNEMVVEPLAYAIGKDQFGLDGNILPVQAMSKGNATYLVSPWTTGKQFYDFEQGVRGDAVAELSTPLYTKMHLFEYVIGNHDQGMNNIMLDQATGTVRLIDNGLAFNGKKKGVYLPDSQALDTARAIGLTRATDEFVSVSRLGLASPAVKDIAAKGDSIIASAKAAGIAGKSLSNLKARIQAVKDLALLDEPTVGDLQDLNGIA
jgi:HK97 family phage portal protein